MKKLVVIAPHCDDEIVGTGSRLDSISKIIYVTTDYRREKAIKFCKDHNIDYYFLDYKDSSLVDLKEEDRMKLVRSIKTLAGKDTRRLIPSVVDRNTDHTML